MGEHRIPQHRRAARAHQPQPRQRQVASGGVEQKQRGGIVDQRRAQVLLQHQHQERKHREREPRQKSPARHVPAQDQKQRQLHQLAGLHAGTSDVDPVGRAVLLGADGQRQGQQCRRAQHDHLDQKSPAPHVAHHKDACQHGDDARAVIDGLLDASRGARAAVGGVEDQHAQRAQEVGNGQQQLVGGEKARHPHRGQTDKHRHDHRQREALPFQLTVKGYQQKRGEEKQHDGRNQHAVRTAALPACGLRGPARLGAGLGTSAHRPRPPPKYLSHTLRLARSASSWPT